MPIDQGSITSKSGNKYKQITLLEIYGQAGQDKQEFFCHLIVTEYEKYDDDSIREVDIQDHTFKVSDLSGHVDYADVLAKLDPTLYSHIGL